MFLQALGSTTTTATAVLFFCSEGQGRVSRCFYSSDVLVLMCLPTSLVWGSSRLIAAPSSLHPPGPSVFSFLGGRMHFLLQETEEDTLLRVLSCFLSPHFPILLPFRLPTLQTSSSSIRCKDIISLAESIHQLLQLCRSNPSVNCSSNWTFTDTDTQGPRV